MRRGDWARFGGTVAAVLGAALFPAAGCGSNNGLVGGTCEQGYTPCGTNCCAVGLDGALDGTMDGATDGRTDGGDSDLEDGSDEASFDDRGGLLGDTGTDGTTGEGSTSDGSANDGSTRDGTIGDGSSNDGSLTDGETTETGPLCIPPLVDCSGVCVDTTSDPFNCGSCGHVCPSVICENSVCIGSTTGGIVFAGHDYQTTAPGTAQARVLTNAAFLEENNPLQVMSFEHYANATAISRVKTILNDAATQLGRTVDITSTSTDADIPNNLKYASFQVLIVHDQRNAPTGALTTLGTSWATTLTTFTAQGGVVIVLDGGQGIAQMPQFSTATGLLSVTAQAPIVTGTQLLDVAPGDAIGFGVVSPYGAGANSVSITTEPNGGNVTYVIEDPVEGGTGLPVVVHKAF